jgi:6-phosphogluconolactonase
MNSMPGARYDFKTRESLAAALSNAVGQALDRVIARKGHAKLAVSGGTTPQLFFEHLSHSPLAWDKVTITLVDERQVDETSPRSNARLVKGSLLKNRAAAATFVPLFQNAQAAARLTLDVVMLGMGLDGHTASFFPGGDRLRDALDPANREGVIAITAPGAGEPRLTFALAKLLSASFLFLHIEGRDKATVLETALQGEDVLAMPIRAVLNSGKPLSIYWCD